MKKVIMCAAASLLFLLCACSVLSTEGEYQYMRPHTESSSSDVIDQDVISTYDDLYNAALNIINWRIENDTLLVGNYESDLEQDLEKITQEITEAYPLGAYSVSAIVYKQVNILSYTEVTVSVQYKRSIEELRRVMEVSGTDNLERRLKDDFSFFRTADVMHISSFTDSEEDWNARVMKCWLNSDMALGLHDWSCVFYPERRTENILELTVNYTLDSRELAEQKKRIKEAAAEICAGFEGGTAEDKINFVYGYLHDFVIYDRDVARYVAETGGRQPKTSVYTAYGALAEKYAAQSGMALAAKVLLAELDVEAMLMEGTKAGLPHYWLYIGDCDGEVRHFDVTAWSELPEPEAPEADGDGEPGEPESDGEARADIFSAPYLFSSQYARTNYKWNRKVYGIY